MKHLSPTRYPDVNIILNTFLNKITEILNGQLLGVYLFGSLANGDFDVHSDVDVLVVTKDEITRETFSALYLMHERIAVINSPWATQLEVSYVPQTTLRRHDPSNNKHPHIDRGSGEKLHTMQHDSDWIIQRYILRERGLTIVGPEPRSLIDPISSSDLKQAVLDILHNWIKGFLEDPSLLETRGYQSYTVLTLCRILYTYRFGTIVSKPVAVEWVKANFNRQWKPLIKQAWIDRQSPNAPARPEDVKATMGMIKYALKETGPTPYIEVNEVLKLLHTKGKEILGDQFVGMYLYGSLSSGDFNPTSSDIDFLFVTESVLSQEMINRLEDMHKQTWATSLKRAGKLEGSYVPRDLIRKHDPDGTPCPTVNEGKFFLDKRGSDWIIQRHVIRECGVIIEGPDPKTLIDFVTPDDIRSAVMGTLTEWWFPMLDNPTWLREGEDGDRAYAVITMCRVLHALETGTITSKPKAAKWTQEKLNEQWKELIDRAIAVSNHESQDVTLGETLDFIRFIKEKTQ